MAQDPWVPVVQLPWESPQWRWAGRCTTTRAALMATLMVEGMKSVCSTRCDVCIVATACDTFQNILYLWLRFAFILFFLLFFLVVEFGTSDTVFAFLFLLFIRPRRLYTYKLQKLARRQDMQHIRKKDTCTLHYAPVALLVCSADFPLVSGIASHRTAFICACLRSLAIITMQSYQHCNQTHSTARSGSL